MQRNATRYTCAIQHGSNYKIQEALAVCSRALVLVLENSAAARRTAALPRGTPSRRGFSIQLTHVDERHIQEQT